MFLGSARRASRRTRYWRNVSLISVCLAALPPVNGWSQVVPASTAAPALSAWTIDAVVSTALAQHPLVGAGMSRVEASRGERRSAGAWPNPVGTFWVENVAFPGRPAIPGFTREISGYVTLPIEPFFQRASRVRRADEGIKAAAATLASTRRQVAADAVRAFFGVALAQALADEAEENRVRLDQLAAYNDARVTEGVTAEGELLRIRIELDQAATAVVMARVDLTRSRAALRPYLAGRLSPISDLGAITVVVPGEADRAASALPTLALVLERANVERPEVVSGLARIAAADADVAYERTLGMRQFGATFGAKGAEGRASMIGGVSVAVPLFNRNGGGVDRATSDLLAIKEELDWTRRTIAGEVEGAHLAATQLTRQLEILQQSFLARAEDVHRLTLGAYQEGGATLLQVLDATRMLADARLTYLRTLLAQRSSVFELALSTGAEPETVLQLFHTWSGMTPRSVSGGQP